MSHNPGPWRIKGYAVLCDTPVPEIGGANDVEHYGGHLICESVVRRNAVLIAAAPDLLEALQAFVDCDDRELAHSPETAARARAAIAKAKGQTL